MTISYHEVQNVYVVRPENFVADEPWYEVRLFIKDRGSVLLREGQFYNRIVKKAYKWHQFLFGRFNPNYKPPADIRIPEA